MTGEVSLTRRRADYQRALTRAERAAERYLDARVLGRPLPHAVIEEMDGAQAELRRAKRGLEETERRLAKRKEKPNG